MGRIGRWSLRALLAAALVGAGIAGVGLVAAGLAAQASVAGAASPSCTKFWAGPISGDWGDAADWAPAGVPTSSDNVCIDAAGSYTVTANYYEVAGSLTLGGVGANVTLALDPGDGVTVSGPSTIESGSSVDVVAGSGTSYLEGKSTTFTNDGAVTVPATGSLDFGTSGTLTFVNAAKGSVTDDGAVNVSGSFSDHGPISLGATATWTVGEYGTFTHAGGTISNSGTFSTSGNNFLKFVQSGGSIKGNALELNSTAIVDSGGIGPIQLTYNDVLTGTIPSGQTVSLLSGLFLGSAKLTNDGTLECTGTRGGAGNTIVDGTMIDNAGSLVVDAGSACDLEVPLTNTGNVDIKGSLFPAYSSDNAVVNAGSFKVEKGGTFNNDIAGSGPSSPFTNEPSGTVINNGTLDIASSTFTSDGNLGGTQPITFANSTLDDQAGAGAFVLYGTDIVTGTVPTGQTLAVRGSAGYGVGQLSLGGAVLTNDGAITLGTENGNSAWIITGGAGGSLVNNGTVTLLAPPSGVSSSPDALLVPVTNAAGGSILVLSPWAYVGNPSGYGPAEILTNRGTLTIAAGAQLSLEGCNCSASQGSSIVMGATGVLNVTVDAKTGAPVAVAAIVQGFYGPAGSLALGGTLAVTTLGAPHGTFSVITGVTLTGHFAGYQFGAYAYTVTKTGASVSVKTAKPFTLTAENFSGTAGQPVDATLATVTGSSTAKYTVSVSWGDGATSAGTFTPAAGGGAVSGVHTYSAAGTYTVTTTVACANGTTRTTSSTATIAAG